MLAACSEHGRPGRVCVALEAAKIAANPSFWIWRSERFFGQRGPWYEHGERQDDDGQELPPRGPRLSSHAYPIRSPRPIRLRLRRHVKDSLDGWLGGLTDQQ